MTPIRVPDPKYADDPRRLIGLRVSYIPGDGYLLTIEPLFVRDLDADGRVGSYSTLSDGTRENEGIRVRIALAARRNQKHLEGLDGLAGIYARELVAAFRAGDDAFIQHNVGLWPEMIAPGRRPNVSRGASRLAFLAEADHAG